MSYMNPAGTKSSTVKASEMEAYKRYSKMGAIERFNECKARFSELERMRLLGAMDEIKALIADDRRKASK